MMSKSKVFVFWGAPCPQKVSLESQEKQASHWKTMNLTWSEGKFVPEDVMEAPTPIDRNLGKEDGLQSVGLSERVPVTETIESCQKSGTLPDCQNSPSSGKVFEEERLCPLSVREYLDGCFTEPQTKVVQSQDKDVRSDSTVSVATEYLSTWTKSQALFLQCNAVLSSSSDSGSARTSTKEINSITSSPPELYSPMVSPEAMGLGGTLQSSLDFTYENMSQQQQTRGVILEMTTDGMVCSQNNAMAGKSLDCEVNNFVSAAQPSPSHVSKKFKLSPIVRECKEKSRNTGFSCGPTTLLTRCKAHGVQYNILVAVVHPCHLKEVKVKTGPSAGTSIPLATLIVTDQADSEMKVVLWRTAAFWALTVHPGDILLLTGVSVHIDKWKSETVLQSSFNSKMLNLGQISRQRVPPAPQNVNLTTLRTLCTYLCEKRPLLVSFSTHTHQDLHSIPFTRLGSLRPDTMVHALVKVKHIHLFKDWRDEAEGTSRAGGVLKAVLTVEQGDGQQGAVVLWGDALSWLQRFEKKDAVWEFKMLFVRQDVTSGLPELHSTPWATCQPIFPDDNRCKEFYISVESVRTTRSFEIDLSTLLSQKYSGDIVLRVKITAFQFHSSPSQEASQLIDCNTSSDKILDIVSGDITFAGCGHCAAELETDENGIYRPCYPCLPHTGVRRYYRPVVLTVRDGGDHQICLQVPSALVQKMLVNTSPDKLNKTIGPSSETRFVHVVANRISSMLIDTNPFVLTVQSHFQCDENSIPIIQNFLLLDFNSQET